MSNNKKWTTQDIPDQTGRVVIVTGANSGVGYEATRALALHNATVVMACRSLDKGAAAAAEIRKEDSPGQVNLLQLDLADLGSVRQFAESFLKEYDRLDVLVNNAGIMATPRGKTADGFELQFGTNHLGHFALTALLISLLKNTPSARVVTVSSFGHFFGGTYFWDLNSEKFFQRWLAYCRSKLANLLFGFELQRRLAKGGGNPVSTTAHPGYSATNLQHTSGLFSALNPIIAQSAEMGALPILYAATSPEIRGGEYIGPQGLFGVQGYPHRAMSSRTSKDEKAAKRLWAASEALTGVRFEL